MEQGQAPRELTNLEAKLLKALYLAVGELRDQYQATRDERLMMDVVPVLEDAIREARIVQGHVPPGARADLEDLF